LKYAIWIIGFQGVISLPRGKILNGNLFSFGFSSWQVLKFKNLLKFLCLVLVDSKNIDICLNILFSFKKKPDLAKLSSTRTHHPPTTIMVQTK